MLIKVFKSLQDNTNCERIVKFFRTFEINDKEDYDKFKKENSIESYLFTHIIYKIRHGMYNKDKHKLNEKDLQKINQRISELQAAGAKGVPELFIWPDKK